MEKIVDIPRATQDELRGELRALFQGAIRLTLEMVLEEELKAMVGARRFERIGSRKDHRNGTFLRRLLTSMGQIEGAVPGAARTARLRGCMGRSTSAGPKSWTTGSWRPTWAACRSARWAT